VPLGRAPAGTNTDVLAPPALKVNVVGVVNEVVTESGVPKDVAGTPEGGGAGVSGPVEPPLPPPAPDEVMGVTAAEAPENEPVPIELIAATLKV
jgi:hypothetical protein